MSAGAGAPAAVRPARPWHPGTSVDAAVAGFPPGSSRYLSGFYPHPSFPGADCECWGNQELRSCGPLSPAFACPCHVIALRPYLCDFALELLPSSAEWGQ